MNREEFQALFERLTLREKETLEKIATGMSDREIAEQLHVTRATVRQHIRSIVKKFFPFDSSPGRPKRTDLITLVAKYPPFSSSPSDISSVRDVTKTSFPKQLRNVSGTERSLPKIVPDNGIADNDSREHDRKVAVTLHIDSDVLAWFQAQGERSEELMNAALRIYARAHQEP